MCEFSILALKWEVKFHTDYVYPNKLYQNISVDLTKQAENIGGKKESVSEEAKHFCFVLPVLAQLSLNWSLAPPFLCLWVPHLNLVSLCSVGLTNPPVSNDSLLLPPLFPWTISAGFKPALLHVAYCFKVSSTTKTRSYKHKYFRQNNQSRSSQNRP